MKKKAGKQVPHAGLPSLMAGAPLRLQRYAFDLCTTYNKVLYTEQCTVAMELLFTVHPMLQHRAAATS